MFRGAYRDRRCLVPVDGWYEWQKQPDGRKQAHAFAAQDGQPLAFAGLWESVRWPDGEMLRTFAIVTTEPSTEAAVIHDRMPLALREADWPLWLGENDGNPATLLRPAPDGARCGSGRSSRRWARAGPTGPSCWSPHQPRALIRHL